MKIVMIGPFAFAPKGTVSARLFYAARALVKRGHQVTILIPPYDNLADSGKQWIRDGVQVANMVIRRVTPVTPVTVALAMARRAQAMKPDVIHVFKPIGYSGLAEYFLSEFCRVPLVLDHDDWEGRGGWADVNPYPRLWRWFFIRQEPDSIRRACAVTVASRTLQTQVWGLGIDPARVFYVPNGPDESWRTRYQESADRRLQTRAELGMGDAPMAAYVGHIPHGNDLDQALDAMERLLPDVPDLRFVILGTGDGVPALRADIARRGLDRAVILIGWTDHVRVPDYLAAADLAIYPYRDSLINRAKCAGKIVEYMAMGLPIVASRVGQNVEYIEHGTSGLLAEPGDADSFAQMMRAILSDPQKAKAMGAAARERVWARFDWDKLVETVEQAYQISNLKSQISNLKSAI
jgi:glycosyltransferase involved in cell wall biosynthesis